MSLLDQNLAIPKTLIDYLEARDRILELDAQTRKLIDMTKQIGDECGQHIYPYEGQPRLAPDQFKKQLDQNFWRLAFDKTGFLQIMDAEAKRKFEDSLRYTPPEFTMANIRSTFLSLHQESSMMFRRGIVNVFRALDREYRTNEDGFKIGSKLIVEFVFELGWSGGLCVTYNAQGKINDLDRVVKVLDGTQHNPREFEFAINAAMKAGNVYEDDYYRIKGFKNGNAHIELKRQDLVDKINDLLAEHFGDRSLGVAA